MSAFYPYRSGECRSAFTLLEMVVALAILAVLAGLSVGVVTNQRARAKEDKARADLQVIQIGLEAYRARFGDYPKIPNSFAGLEPVDTNKEYLLNALCGRIGPAHQKVNGIASMLNASVLDFAVAGLPLENLQENWIVDPWGNAYEYDYRPSDTQWLQFGYKLRSFGPDGVKAASGVEDDILAE